jgi:hypothetical protein
MNTREQENPITAYARARAIQQKHRKIYSSVFTRSAPMSNLPIRTNYLRRDRRSGVPFFARAACGKMRGEIRLKTRPKNLSETLLLNPTRGPLQMSAKPSTRARRK